MIDDGQLPNVGCLISLRLIAFISFRVLNSPWWYRGVENVGVWMQIEGDKLVVGFSILGIRL